MVCADYECTKGEAEGCSTYFNKKDHLWTLYEYEKGIFKIPEDIQDGMIYGGCNCGNCHMTILHRRAIRRFDTKQIETHEVISGSGVCANDGKKIKYEAGVYQ